MLIASANPYLGMRDGPSALYSFPSEGNLCHRCRPPVMPALAQHAACCLKGDQKDCAVYLQAEGKAFSRELAPAKDEVLHQPCGLCWGW